MIVREMKIKVTMRYHFTHTRMAIIFFLKSKITSAGEDPEKLQPSYITGRNVKWCNCCGKQLGSSSKSKLPYDTAIPFLGIFPREIKTYVHAKTYT